MTCRLARENLEIRTDGTVSICCISSFRVTDATGAVMNIEQGLDNILAQSSLEDYRTRLEQGLATPECSACWSTEQAGMHSKRMVENKRFGSREFKSTLTSLDLKLGNTCNLKCRSCSSFASTRYMAEEIAIYGRSYSKKTEWADESDVLMELTALSDDIEYIEFSGGEPLLIKNQFKFIEQLVQSGISKNIRLQYHTNTTIFPEEHIETLNKFKSINIVLSIDNLEDQFEYMRYPAKWDVCLDNIEKFKSTGFDMGISHSISALNVYYLPEFLAWAHENQLATFINVIHNPFNFTQLSNNTKQGIVDKLNRSLPTDTKYQVNPVTKENNWIASLMSQQQGNSNKEFLDKIARVDSYRKQSYKDTFPEMYKLLNDN